MSVNTTPKWSINNIRVSYICLLVLGIILTISGIIFNPIIIARYLIPDGILAKQVVVRIYLLNGLSIILGLIVSFYSVVTITKPSFARKVDEKIETYIIRPLNQYWFTPTSLRRLAIFRILIFMFLALDSMLFSVPRHIERLKNASPEFFKPEYLLFVDILDLGPPSLFVLDVIRFLLPVFALGAMIGFRTRFCIFGSLILYVYQLGMWWSFEGIHHSQPIFIFAMTALLLSPCGEVLSIDEIIARMRALGGKGEFKGDRTEKLKSDYALWPMRLIQVLLAIIYFNAGYWKVVRSGFSWADGFSLQFSLIRNYFRGEYITDIGIIISHYPIVMKLFSTFTLIFELGFPLVLVFPKLAWIWLPVGFLFHLGTGFMMNVWFIHFWFCYIAFINLESCYLWLRDKFRVP